MIKAEIIADSINSANGSRITSWILEYPRMVHSEFLTHRMFSKNAASSRAIPIDKMIQQIIDNPAMPIWWGKNQSGMQANEELDDNNQIKYFYDDYNTIQFPYDGGAIIGEKELAKQIWLESRDRAIEQVQKLNKLGLHKQIANRILEPWFNIRIIMTATEIENFFALRAHKDAQPEIRVLAEQMLELYNKSTPQFLTPGDWHIPFGDKINENNNVFIELDNEAEYMGDYNLCSKEAYNELKIKIAIARCARVSYFNYQGKDDYAADIKLCDRLFGSVPRHLSPTEHVAQATKENNFIANFKGFKQYRYFFNDQNLSDPRIIKK